MRFAYLARNCECIFFHSLTVLPACHTRGSVHRWRRERNHAEPLRRRGAEVVPVHDEAATVDGVVVERDDTLRWERTDYRLVDPRDVGARLYHLGVLGVECGDVHKEVASELLPAGILVGADGARVAVMRRCRSRSIQPQKAHRPDDRLGVIGVISNVSLA